MVVWKKRILLCWFWYWLSKW